MLILRSKNSFLVALIASLAAGPAFAQQADATGIASVTIVHPLSAQELRDLDFGIVPVDAEAESRIVVAPAMDSGGAGHAAIYAVSGQPFRQFFLSIPSEIALIGNGARTDVLSVQGLSLHSAGANGSRGSFLFDSDGTQTVVLGGTLAVSSEARPGVYQGRVRVTVAYE